MIPRSILATFWIIALSITAHGGVEALEVESPSVDSIVWYDYADGKEIALREHKPMVFFFYRNNCPYCRKLNAESLADTSLAHYVNTNAIPIRINTLSTHAIDVDTLQMPESQFASERWLVRSVPCMWVTESDGCRVKKLVGLKACSNVRSVIQEVVDHSYGDCPDLPLVAPKPAVQDSTSKLN